MTYVDTSVILATVFAEPVSPGSELWSRPALVTSRLSEMEAWVRVHAYGRGATHGASLAAVLARLDVVELDEASCARCRAPFPTPVRTLDALHLATADFLRCQGFVLEFACYDRRLASAATAMGFALATT